MNYYNDYELQGQEEFYDNMNKQETTEYRHKHIDGLTISIVSDTKKGYKVKQFEVFNHLGRKHRKVKETIQYYDTAQINELFTPLN